MTRIIAEKQIEQGIAPRMILITVAPDNDFNFQDHDAAIAADTDFTLWAVFPGVLDTANDTVLIRDDDAGIIYRLAIDDLLGVVQNGMIRQPTGEIELGGNQLIKATIIPGNGQNFGVTAADDFVFTGGGQILIQMTGQAELRGDGGVTVRSDGSGNVFIGQDGDTVELGNTLTTVNVGSRYRLNVAVDPDSTLNKKQYLVWTGNGADSDPAFEDIPTGGPQLYSVTDTVTAKVRYFGSSPTFADTGDGQYTFTIPTGTVIMSMEMEGNDAAGMLNSGTGDLTLIINNSGNGDYIHPAFPGYFNRGNDQWSGAPGSFGIQFISTNGAAGITTNTFTNLGGFGTPGWRVKLTGF